MLSNSHLNILLSQQSLLLLLLPPYYSYFAYYYPLQRGTSSPMGGWVVGTFRKTLVWRTVAFLLSFFGWSVDKKLFLISKTKQRICSSETLERRGGRQTAQLNSEMTNSSFVRSLARMLCIVLKVRLLLRSPVRYDDEKRRRRCTLVFVDCVVGSREGVKLVRLSVCCCCINVCMYICTHIYFLFSSLV